MRLRAQYYPRDRALRWRPACNYRLPYNNAAVFGLPAWPTEMATSLGTRGIQQDRLWTFQAPSVHVRGLLADIDLSAARLQFYRRGVRLSRHCPKQANDGADDTAQPAQSGQRLHPRV